MTIQNHVGDPVRILTFTTPYDWIGGGIGGKSHHGCNNADSQATPMGKNWHMASWSFHHLRGEGKQTLIPNRMKGTNWRVCLYSV